MMRNIIITGGELFNKGAQAMTFIAVDEMKRRFPDHRILVLSEMDLQRPENERAQYAFDFMGWYPIKFAKCQSNPTLRLLCRLRTKKELREAEEIYGNTDLMIDISGYALGSNWGVRNCSHYLEHLEFARAFHIPVYLMPQSFGPFDFEGEEGRKTDERIADLLPYARLICAREREGYDALITRYHLENVILTNDLVLNNRGIDLNHIFHEPPSLMLPEIRSGSTAVIPNCRNTEVADSEKATSCYETLISGLLKCSSDVYLIMHSDTDRGLCLSLKKKFSDEDRVIFLDRELNCLEFNELVKKFDFIAASRFHAIVHAFKNGVPCIALGWAAKYRDLMDQFHQGAYMLDIREDISEQEIERIVFAMRSQYLNEAACISSALESVQTENVFDQIELAVG